MKKTFIANIALIITSAIWGVSFVAQRAAMEHVGPCTFNALRCLLGAFCLLPVALFVHENNSKQLIKGGLLCGGILFSAMSLQQYCMQYVGAGKAGFISSLYLIFVPIISVFLGKFLTKNVILSIFTAVIGLYLLCYKAGGSFDIYDGILLFSALLYGVHIMLVGKFSPNVNPVKLSCLQFFVVGILSSPFMLLFETPGITDILTCKGPILYAGILTCAVAFTLQIFGQKHAAAVTASLILSLESVFAVMGGMLFLGETMTVREIFGCVLMIIAVILSELKFQPRVEQLPVRVLTVAQTQEEHSKIR